MDGLKEEKLEREMDGLLERDGEKWDYSQKWREMIKRQTERHWNYYRDCYQRER